MTIYNENKILEERFSIYDKMLKKYGGECQVLMAVEECSELQQAILKFLRDKCSPIEISEEMADVEIMLEQLKVVFNNKDEVEDFKKQKLIRTAKLYL